MVTTNTFFDQKVLLICMSPGLRFCASKVVYFTIFYYVMNMASAYKAEPTSGAKLVKGVKEELKKCPRHEHLLQKLKSTRDLKESASRTQRFPTYDSIKV